MPLIHWQEVRLQQIHIKEMYEMIEVIVLFCLVCVSVPLLLYDFLIFALSNSSRFNGLWNSPTIWSSTSVHLHLKTPERPLRPALLEPSASAFGPIDRPSIGPPRRPARRRATSSSLWRLRLAVAGGRVLYGSFPGEEPRRVGGLVGDFRWVMFFWIFLDCVFFFWGGGRRGWQRPSFVRRLGWIAIRQVGVTRVFVRCQERGNFTCWTDNFHNKRPIPSVGQVVFWVSLFYCTHYILYIICISQDNPLEEL